MRSKLIFSVAFLIAILNQGIRSQGQLAITGATVIDGTGKPPIPNATIIVGPDGKISDISSGKIPPSGTRVMDATGKFIIPGLWDAHMHYRDWMPELFLHYGVVQVADLGNPTEWIVAVRDGVAAGKIPGPRMFVCGEPIGAPKELDEVAHGFQYVSSVDDARKIAQEYVSQGVDCLKTWTYITPEESSAISEVARQAGIRRIGHAVNNNAITTADTGIEQLPHMGGIAESSLKDAQLLKEYEAAYTAHPDNILVHDPSLISKLPDAKLLMDSEKSKEVLHTLLQKGVVLEPDFISTGGAGAPPLEMLREWFFEENLLFTDPNLHYLPDDLKDRVNDFRRRGLLMNQEQRSRAQKGFQNLATFIRDYWNAGGMVIAGTDSSNWEVPGLSTHQELQLLVLAGLTPLEAIQAATYNAAKYWKKDDLYGSLQVGKTADLVILSADPLADIRNTRKIVAVYKEGKQVDTRFHPSFSNPLPEPYLSVEQYHNQPVPKIVDWLPKVATEGADHVTITLVGSGFVKASIASFDGHTLPTEFMSPSRVRFTVPAALLTRAGTFPMVVSNEFPMDSNIRFFVVRFK